MEKRLAISLVLLLLIACAKGELPPSPPPPGGSATYGHAIYTGLPPWADQLPDNVIVSDAAGNPKTAFYPGEKVVVTILKSKSSPAKFFPWGTLHRLESGRWAAYQPLKHGTIQSGWATDQNEPTSFEFAAGNNPADYFLTYMCIKSETPSGWQCGKWKLGIITVILPTAPVLPQPITQPTTVPVIPGAVTVTDGKGFVKNDVTITNFEVNPGDSLTFVSTLNGDAELQADNAICTANDGTVNPILKFHHGDSITCSFPFIKAPSATITVGKLTLTVTKKPAEVPVIPGAVTVFDDKGFVKDGVPVSTAELNPGESLKFVSALSDEVVNLQANNAVCTASDGTQNYILKFPRGSVITCSFPFSKAPTATITVGDKPPFTVSKKPTEVPNIPGVQRVLITASGPVPSILTVKPGGSLQFVSTLTTGIVNLQVNAMTPGPNCEGVKLQPNSGNGIICSFPTAGDFVINPGTANVNVHVGETVSATTTAATCGAGKIFELHYQYGAVLMTSGGKGPVNHETINVGDGIKFYDDISFPITFVNKAGAVCPDSVPVGGSVVCCFHETGEHNMKLAKVPLTVSVLPAGFAPAIPVD